MKPNLFVKASAILAVGSERNIWAYASRELRTAQLALLRLNAKRSLNDLPQSQRIWGWVTDSGRPLGVGITAEGLARKGEVLCRIEIPVPLTGVDLRAEVTGYKAVRAAKKKSPLRVVRRVA